MEILFLGTSGYGITKTRKLPAILIDKTILFDCGEGTFQNLINYDIFVDQIKAIFLTHLHADHSLGLLSFLWKWAFYSSNLEPRNSIPIYVPKGMKTRLKSILRSTFSTFDNTNFEINIIELDPTPSEPLKLKIGKKRYTIEWIKTRHKPTCLAYKINYKVIYSGDSAPFRRFIPFVENIDLLIHESSFPDGMEKIAHKVRHSTPSDAAKLARKGDVKSLILTHVPDLSPKEEDPFICKAEKIFTPIKIAQDGDIFRV
jgi:ribonuclease Z